MSVVDSQGPVLRRPTGLPVRVQLTLSYAAFLLLVWIALFAVGFLVLRFVPDENLVTTSPGSFPAPRQSDLVEVFVRYAVWALLALTTLGLGGGWLIAGHMLKPLNRMAAAARMVRDGSLNHRIRLSGRRNELTELADTFDDMLDRVQRSVDEHRRFAANASHELRTPHAVIRTMLEVAQSSPGSLDVDRLLQRLTETNERSISLTQALLDLADADHSRRPLVPLDLDDTVALVAREVADDVNRARLNVIMHLNGGMILGDQILLRQLVSNLLRNAIFHNIADGEIHISTSHTPVGGSTLQITNTGPIIDPAVLKTLTEPFTRGSGRTRRAGEHHTGSGLGLAIVASIARVHSATLNLSASEQGGITVCVGFAPVI
jgi:two-component system sensor histidine kinase VanS